jgi:Ribonuclease HI
MLTVHTDASVDPAEQEAGIGWILTDNTGEEITHNSRIGYRESTSAEWVGVIHALSWIATNKDTDAVMVNTDSNSVAEVADGKSTPTAKSTQRWYARFRKLTTYFETVIVNYIPSARNGKADRLARTAYRK